MNTTIIQVIDDELSQSKIKGTPCIQVQGIDWPTQSLGGVQDGLSECEGGKLMRTCFGLELSFCSYLVPGLTVDACNVNIDELAKERACTDCSIASMLVSILSILS